MTTILWEGTRPANALEYQAALAGLADGINPIAEARGRVRIDRRVEVRVTTSYSGYGWIPSSDPRVVHAERKTAGTFTLIVDNPHALQRQMADLYASAWAALPADR